MDTYLVVNMGKLVQQFVYRHTLTCTDFIPYRAFTRTFIEETIFSIGMIFLLKTPVYGPKFTSFTRIYVRNY